MPAEITVKVLSYNVYMRDQVPDWIKNLDILNSARAPLIADRIARSDYDVVVFQEAFDDEPRERMGQILRNQGKFLYQTTVVGRNSGLKSDGGVFIASRWPIVRQGQIVYKEGDSWDGFANKGVAWALIDKQGFHFNVFGTHTQADGDKKYPGLRQSQFKEMREMVDRVGLYWQPALLAGDLNVNYCFDADRQRGACESFERGKMLETLRATPPRDLSRFTYTSDPGNDLKEKCGPQRWYQEEPCT
ncbi:MAG TPA: sphingomyelin phosphodiesterase, partial [Longimicrobiaceae bacterium]